MTPIEGWMYAAMLVIPVLGLLVYLKLKAVVAHNGNVRVIYDFVQHRLAEALEAEQVSFEEFAVAVNEARDVYNESLVGSKRTKDKLMLPHMGLIPTKSVKQPRNTQHGN